MGGVARVISSVFKAPVKLFKTVTKTLNKGNKKRQSVISQAPALQEATNQARRTSMLGGGGTSTLMSGSSGVTEEAKKARTTLGT